MTINSFGDSGLKGIGLAVCIGVFDGLHLGHLAVIDETVRLARENGWVFTEKGFEWGGAWEDRKDYQHFEIPTEQIAEWYPDNV